MSIFENCSKLFSCKRSHSGLSPIKRCDNVFILTKIFCLFQRMQRAALTRWFVNFLIGVYVAVIAVLVALLIHYLSYAKFLALYTCILYSK